MQDIKVQARVSKCRQMTGFLKKASFTKCYTVIMLFIELKYFFFQETK